MSVAVDTARQHEETARYVDGERYSVVSRFPVSDAAGAVVGVGGVATDITEAKAAEQALREQRTLLAEAQKLAGLGCWEWDPETGRLIWSEELYRIYGVDHGVSAIGCDSSCAVATGSSSTKNGASARLSR